MGGREQKQREHVNLRVDNVTIKGWTKKDVLQDWNYYSIIRSTV